MSRCFSGHLKRKRRILQFLPAMVARSETIPTHVDFMSEVTNALRCITLEVEAELNNVPIHKVAPSCLPHDSSSRRFFSEFHNKIGCAISEFPTMPT